MPRETTEADRPLDPEIRRFIVNLAIADARRDHLIATGQLDPEGEPSELAFEGNQARDLQQSERGPGVRLRKVAS